MHFHPNLISLDQMALTSAQAAENALAARRAKELREAASRLQASSYEIIPEIGRELPAEDMAAVWADSAAASGGGNPPAQASQIPASLQKVSYWA